jgi:hypothetical protein
MTLMTSFKKGAKMNRDKQIEEKACTNCLQYKMCLENFRRLKANGFYEMTDEKEYFAHADDCDFFITGYRKASDVAREIFEEIEKEIELAIDSNYRAKKEHYNHSVIPNYDNFNAMCDGKIYAMRGLLDFIKELQEKKYTGKDTNVTTKESEKDNDTH